MIRLLEHVITEIAIAILNLMNDSYIVRNRDQFCWGVLGGIANPGVISKNAVNMDYRQLPENSFCISLIQQESILQCNMEVGLK